MAREPSVGSERAIRMVAENKLRTAIDEGQFDNLPGFGEPLPLLDEPYDPHWWIRRKLKREGLSVNPHDGWLDNCSR